MRVLPPAPGARALRVAARRHHRVPGEGAREGAEFDELALAYLESAGATITQRSGKLAGASIDALVRGANGKVFCVLAHTLRQRARDWLWQTLSGGRQEAEWDVLELEPGPEELAEAADLARRVRGGDSGASPRTEGCGGQLLPVRAELSGDSDGSRHRRPGRQGTPPPGEIKSPWEAPAALEGGAHDSG